MKFGFAMISLYEIFFITIESLPPIFNENKKSVKIFCDP